jgi:hypothetical protein
MLANGIWMGLKNEGGGLWLEEQVPRFLDELDGLCYVTSCNYCHWIVLKGQASKSRQGPCGTLVAVKTLVWQTGSKWGHVHAVNFKLFTHFLSISMHPTALFQSNSFDPYCHKTLKGNGAAARLLRLDWYAIQ